LAASLDLPEDPFDEIRVVSEATSIVNEAAKRISADAKTAKAPDPQRSRELWARVLLQHLWWAKLGCAQTMR